MVYVKLLSICPLDIGPANVLQLASETCAVEPIGPKPRPFCCEPRECWDGQKAHFSGVILIAVHSWGIAGGGRQAGRLTGLRDVCVPFAVWRTTNTQTGTQTHQPNQPTNTHSHESIMNKQNKLSIELTRRRRRRRRRQLDHHLYTIIISSSLYHYYY